MPASSQASFEARLRFRSKGRLMFGPGKADLLEWINQTGSIRRASGKMKMSYNRAWQLVQAMNKDFRELLVARERGGAEGGGARLTPAGREVLLRYRKMAAASQKAAEREWGKLHVLVR